MKTMLKPLSPLSLIMFLLLCLAAAGCQSAGQTATTPEYTYAGSVVPNGTVQLEDFELVGVDGPVRLSDFAGKHVIIYFGYTFCPDFCPTTLSQMKRIRASLGDNADELQVIMVSVDPERDSPEKMAEYVTHFDPSFVGLTGTKAQIDAAGAPFGVFYEIGDVAEDKNYYLVNHTTRTFLVGPDRKPLLTWPHDTSNDDIVADLSYIMGITDADS